MEQQKKKTKIKQQHQQQRTQNTTTQTQQNKQTKLAAIRHGGSTGLCLTIFMCVRETTLKSNTRQAETRNKTSHQDNTPAQHTTQSITDPHVDYNDTKHVKQRKMKRKRHHRVKNCYNDTLCVQNMEILIVQICGFCSL